MKPLNRRQFLKAGALGAAALSLPANSWAQIPGANSDIRVAVIGFHGRGNDHIKELRGLGAGVRIVALCDVDQKVLDEHVAEFAKRGQTVQAHRDIRKLLESNEIDAVTIATPNHWHSLAAIWAIQAGKDVYVEKPVSHNVSEGRRVVEAARKHQKIVQTGTQCRSSSGIREAVEWVRAGSLGKITVARGLCYKRRASIGKVSGPTSIPESVDYDLWCGPAPKVPLARQKLHYDWHWVWATGNGDLGNQGIHQMDIARWFLGETALAPRVFSVGGRFGYVDDGETPNTMFVYQDYPSAPLIFEVRGLPARAGSEKMGNFKGASVGNVIECEGGYVLVPNYSSATAFDRQGKEIKHFSGEESHFANFIAAVRSRKREDLRADILEGHLSSALCHTGNISYRLGQAKDSIEIREEIKANPEAEETFGRMLEHLAVNEVDLAKGPAVLGQFLKMNPTAETFEGSAEANLMLTREYREPFVVPARV
jgi:predicted dehydrogenase